MRWPWRRNVLPAAEAERGLARSERTRGEAEELRRETARRWPEVRARTETARQVLRENHLRMMIERALRGEPG